MSTQRLRTERLARCLTVIEAVHETAGWATTDGELNALYTLTGSGPQPLDRAPAPVSVSANVGAAP